jgi:predicted transcriptional regulator
MGQAELAAKAGTTQTQITHYENGDWGCHLPRLRDLAEALNRKPADLMHADALAPKPARRPRKAKTPAEAKQQAKAA